MPRLLRKFVDVPIPPEFDLPIEVGLTYFLVSRYAGGSPMVKSAIAAGGFWAYDMAVSRM